MVYLFPINHDQISEDDNIIMSSGLNVRAANGIFIFLSIVEIIFQTIAIVSMVTDIKIFKIKIPFGNTLWYLISLIVSIYSTTL